MMSRNYLNPKYKDIHEPGLLNADYNSPWSHKVVLLVLYISFLTLLALTALCIAYGVEMLATYLEGVF